MQLLQEEWLKTCINAAAVLSRLVRVEEGEAASAVEEPALSKRRFQHLLRRGARTVMLDDTEIVRLDVRRCKGLRCESPVGSPRVIRAGRIHHRGSLSTQQCSRRGAAAWMVTVAARVAGPVDLKSQVRASPPHLHDDHHGDTVARRRIVPSNMDDAGRGCSSGYGRRPRIATR